ncbi:hypothetical protein DACRYDRAFT_118397 [Dacryopinax primogenitus]|uniref:HMG box domain-containing protein n=1 Tax=Dacryopinax primogenitus (strain DJM 731) TaxID=1858805 RepID=M5FQH1_DACPD|nr:uncharacterized protein DACRYDRAFT_118397 [Dacryopinax primogenitus]EJT99140.1 hypothetical protein DACRYDRAFT_118397 [Dacryopinax primogenitus]
MARPEEQATEGGTQSAWPATEASAVPLKGNVVPTPVPLPSKSGSTISPTMDETEHSSAEAEEEDEMMLEDTIEGDGEVVENGGDAFARLPETATEEEQYQALTQQSLNADGTPKRPMNAFMIWGRRRRPQLADQHPMLRTGDISKLMSDEWSSMPKEEKEHYQNMAKRLKDAFNIRWPQYVYKRRPNNSRRKRKKVPETGAVDPRMIDTSRGGIQKRGSFSSVGTISNITTFSSRPSTARSMSGQSESPPTTASSRVSAGHIPAISSQSGSRAVPAAYSGYARAEGSAPSSWSWQSSSAVQHDLPVPSSTSAPIPSMRRQSSQHSVSGVSSSGPPQFKHEEEEEVVYRSANSPETEHMWHGSGVSRSFNLSDFQPQQRGEFNMTDFQSRDNMASDPNWISQFQMSSSYGMSGSHNAASESRSYASSQSMPLPGFPGGSRGSFSSLNAIHTFGASTSSSQERFAGGSAGASASPGLETSSRTGYSFSGMNGSFTAASSTSSVTPPADQPRSNYFNGTGFGTAVPQARSNVLSIPQQGHTDERAAGGYWSPHGEQPR